MSIEIDQSGKIEQTSKDTVLAISNKTWDAVVIPKKIKRQIQSLFRKKGQTRNFVLFTFCAGITILLKRNKKYGSVVIDQEYIGKEAILINILKEMSDTLPVINFKSIGKSAKAHHYCHDIATGEIPATKRLTFVELLYPIKKTEVGKRLGDA